MGIGEGNLMITCYVLNVTYFCVMEIHDYFGEYSPMHLGTAHLDCVIMTV